MKIRAEIIMVPGDGWYLATVRLPDRSIEITVGSSDPIEAAGTALMTALTDLLAKNHKSEGEL